MGRHSFFSFLPSAFQSVFSSQRQLLTGMAWITEACATKKKSRLAFYYPWRATGRSERLLPRLLRLLLIELTKITHSSLATMCLFCGTTLCALPRKGWIKRWNLESLEWTPSLGMAVISFVNRLRFWPPPGTFQWCPGAVSRPNSQRKASTKHLRALWGPSRKWAICSCRFFAISSGRALGSWHRRKASGS